MLFVLADDLLPFCSAPDGQELDGLQNLLICVRQGKHAVVGPHKIFSALANNANLSERERATARSLANRRTELPLLERQIQRKVFVNASIDANKLKRLADMCWQISVRELNSKFLSELVVLAENMIDAELYQQAGKHYRTKNRLNGLNISTSARGGGGSQIDVELASLLNNGTPVFAITDGDFTFPSRPQSTISNRCEDLVDTERGLGWHFTLPVREIENIIPHTVLLEVADPKNARDAHDSLMELSGTVDKTGNCPSKYACLKFGQTLSDAFASKSPDESAYWVAIAGTIRHQRPKSFNDCLDQESCGSNPCSCRINTGFGEAVLTQVKKWLSERSIHESLQKFDKSELWLDIGAMVFEVGVAFPPVKI